MEPSPESPDKNTHSTDASEIIELNYANPHQAQLFPTRRSVWVLRLIIAFALAAAAFAALAYLAKGSLPGDVLYSFKTRVVEPSMAFMKPSAVRFQYDATLLGSRLEELQTLAADGAPTAEQDLALVASLVTAHTESAIRSIDASDRSFNERLDALTTISHTAHAIETLTESTEEFSPIANQVEETRGRIADAQDTTVESFVETASADDIAALVTALTTELSEQLKTVAPGSTAARQAQSRIGNAHESLLDGDLANALEALLSAREAIAVDAYLWDSERGPNGGAPLPSTTIPEGN
jgi:hypothetical protein